MCKKAAAGLNFDSFGKRHIMLQQTDKNKVTGKEAEDSDKTPAAAEAEKDISEDPDMQPDNSETADLDEGELARADNSND
jgi:hypothetical protein